MPSNLMKTLRTRSMKAQNGRCFWCGDPMCDEDPAAFAKAHGISEAQAQLRRCTAEHLVARRDGGTNAAENIVAACHWCNRLRHARPAPMDPERYRRHVRRRLSRGGWFPGGSLGV